MSDLSDDQADDLLEIAQVLLRTLNIHAVDFCQRHGRLDPRDINKAKLALLETLLEGTLISYFDEPQRVPLMRGISHNVQGILRLREKANRKQRFDA
jgi:hypothetical protein